MSGAYNPALPYLYQRRYALELIPYKQQTGLSYGNETGSSARLRVGFEIERSFASGADKGKIVVFNMTAENRNAIVRGSTVRLRAGYQGNMGLLFTGFVRKVSTEQSGPDTTLTMECGDGEPSIAYAVCRRSYTDSVKLAQVLQDLAQDLGVKIGGQVVEVAPGIIRGIPDQSFPPGLVLEGKVSALLDLYLKSLMIDWAVQNDKLVILPRFAPLYQSAIVLNKDSGMVGVPGFNEKYGTFESLLNPALLPGAYVKVESKNRKVAGYYKLRTCKYAGDSHEAPWSVKMEGEALKEPLPFVPTAQGADFAKAVVK